MHGQIITENDNGARWIHVEEEHIYFRAVEAGDGKMIVVAFRSDGYQPVQGGLIPMLQYLQQTHRFTDEYFNMPSNIVAYAVSSEWARNNPVDVDEILMQDVNPHNPEAGWRKFLKRLEGLPSYNSAEEDKIGRQIAMLIAKEGGP